MIEFETRMHAEVHRLFRITVSTAKQCSRTFPMGSSVALSRVSKIDFCLESGTHSIALKEGRAFFNSLLTFPKGDTFVTFPDGAFNFPLLTADVLSSLHLLLQPLSVFQFLWSLLPVGSCCSNAVQLMLLRNYRVAPIFRKS